MITMENVCKSYRVAKRNAGFGAACKALFHREYEVIEALKDISFTIGNGEMVGYIGPNGAGKSTTIKMLTGILYPDGGRARVLGIDPAKQRKRLAYEIGTVFGQKEQLWTHLTPYDNFRFFGAIYDIPGGEMEGRIRELADTFELDSFLNTPVRNLSLGQRIRCEIVASLIHRPKVLFLDEPTIGLDPVVKENIRALIKQMNRELGTTIFLTSHDVGDIEKLCRRIIIVNSGRIVLDDSMDHLKHHYLNRKIVEAKLGEETALPAAEGITLLKQKGSQVRFQVDTGRLPINEALHLIDAENLEDINISNIPLETIITDIYKAEGREEKAV